MTGTGLNGPYLLDFGTIQEEVVDHCPAAYALGFVDNLDRFCVTFVGRAGPDFKSKLCQHIGTASHFKFRYFVNERAAFEKECEMFHAFLPGGNFLHPGRPANENWTCPSCDPSR